MAKKLQRIEITVEPFEQDLSEILLRVRVQHDNKETFYTRVVHGSHFESFFDTVMRIAVSELKQKIDQ